jgi:hypothetical protein
VLEPQQLTPIGRDIQCDVISLLGLTPLGRRNVEVNRSLAFPIEALDKDPRFTVAPRITYASHDPADWPPGSPVPAFPGATWRDLADRRRVWFVRPYIFDHTSQLPAGRTVDEAIVPPGSGNVEVVAELFQQVYGRGEPFVPPVVSDITGTLTALNIREYSSVEIRAGWIDEDNFIHGTGAFDYFRSPSNRPFPVHAIGDGIVIASGWNISGGNFLVTEHESDGVRFRAFYHHLCNGATHDLALARQTISYCNAERAAGRAPRNRRTLCSDALDRSLAGEVGAANQAQANGQALPGHWGDDRLTVLNVRRGDPVFRGQVLGFAGDTGIHSGDVHLHFGVAVPSPMNPTRFWWGIDPYGLYNYEGSYSGLHPSGDPSRPWQFPSMFAPLMPDHALVALRSASLGRDYYLRRGLHANSVAICSTACALTFSFSYQARLTSSTFVVTIGSRRMLDDMRAQAERGTFPRMIAATQSEDSHFLAIYEQSARRRLVRDSVGVVDPAIDQERERVIDVCVYYQSGRLGMFVVVEEWVDNNLSSEVATGIVDIRAFVAGLRGRVVERIRRYTNDGGDHFVVAHRRQLPGEVARYELAVSRSTFVMTAARNRAAGFHLHTHEAKLTEESEVYYAVFLRGAPLLY